MYEMSQEEINKRIGVKLIKKIRNLPDQEIINLYNDAVSFRTSKQIDLQQILQSAQVEVINELRKEKLKELEEQAERDDNVSASGKVDAEPETPEEEEPEVVETKKKKSKKPSK